MFNIIHFYLSYCPFNGFLTSILFLSLSLFLSTSVLLSLSLSLHELPTAIIKNAHQDNRTNKEQRDKHYHDVRTFILLSLNGK